MRVNNEMEVFCFRHGLLRTKQTTFRGGDRLTILSAWRIPDYKTFNKSWCNDKTILCDC